MTPEEDVELRRLYQDESPYFEVECLPHLRAIFAGYQECRRLQSLLINVRGSMGRALEGMTREATEDLKADLDELNRIEEA